jgi:hypothetical protein
MSKEGSSQFSAWKNHCYLGPILDVLFRKLFPLFEVPSLRITTLEEPMSLVGQDQQVVKE